MEIFTFVQRDVGRGYYSHHPEEENINEIISDILLALQSCVDLRPIHRFLFSNICFPSSYTKLSEIFFSTMQSP